MRLCSKDKSQKAENIVMHENRDKITNTTCGTMLTACVMGANHRENGLPCQDASIAGVYYFKGQPYALLAVADGHGSARYTRSELGAHFAIQATVEAAADWILLATECVEKKPENWLANIRGDFGSHFAKKLRQIWLNKVKEHLEIYPLTDADKKLTDADKKSESEYTVYGTTVALAIIFQGQLFTGTIGDSSVLIITKEDEVLNVLASEQNELEPLGLATHSLVQENAALKWKHNILSVDKVKMLCAVTDGFTDSLADITQTLGSLSINAHSKGFDWLENKLPDFLERLTSQGVGDDIATVFYFPPEKQILEMDTKSGVENE